MKHTTALVLTLLGIALTLRITTAMPPPCSEAELLETSESALEGYVVAVDCGEPYDSGECQWNPLLPEPFLPELVADCTATMLVTHVLKGDLAVGEEVEIPFSRLVRPCENGDPLVPGSPWKDFGLYSKVRYYDSEPCRYWNLVEIEAPFLRGDSNDDGSVDIADAVLILLYLFQGVLVPPNAAALDANADGEVNVSDAVYLLDYLFRGGDPPPAPFPRPRPAGAITVLYDNYAVEADLEVDWGFSCLLQVGSRNLLLDAGRDGSMLFSNMSTLGIEPDWIQSLLLSHIHMDHTGGVASVLQRAPGIPVYLPLSFPETFRTEVRALGCEPLDVEGPLEILPGVHASGEMTASPNEQFVYLRTARGLAIVTGCAHPGIVPIIQEAREQTGAPVYLVMGGFHLFQKSDPEILGIVDSFRELGVRKVAPSHCSGDRTRELFQAEYGDDYIEAGVGLRLAVPQLLTGP